MHIYIYRAYKLGKGRWSYNRCSLTLRQDVVDSPLADGVPLMLKVARAVADGDVKADDQVSHSHEFLGACKIMCSCCSGCLNPKNLQ